MVITSGTPTASASELAVTITLMVASTWVIILSVITLVGTTLIIVTDIGLGMNFGLAGLCHENFGL